ncbi:hypothetical protein RvY_13671 [Ramazzottius varieornatus]|uniref:Chitinase domain-containing protein 1 n=1 Tax=Ramazzottius varieornatus TaxID=947166 RepID=A0A1D1VNQ1_RAMVA|nr:hypothetical protein RvY_13671 [Ramazzottius varieornatus]
MELQFPPLPDYANLLKFMVVALAAVGTVQPKLATDADKDLYSPDSLPQRFVTNKLVTTKPDILDILDYHNTTSLDDGEVGESRRTKHFVLAYVTPWNNKGYDRAMKFAHKFTHISPVWLQAHTNKEASRYVIKGTHDIDAGWVERLRTANKDLRIVPRLLLEGFDSPAYQKLFYDADYAHALASVIGKCLKKYELDGVVLEMWQQLNEDVHRRAMRNAIKTIADKMSKDGFETILVVPPSGGENLPGRFRTEDFNFLASSVKAFSVMTYDHPRTYSSAGAIAPLPWVIDSIESIVPEAKEKSKRKKILLGLNHYGYDFSRKSGANALTSSAYLDQLAKYRPSLQWDATGREHVYKYSDETGEHIVHYPTLKSLDERINLSIMMNVGLAIWDLGQGLEYFLDLL